MTMGYVAPVDDLRFLLTHVLDARRLGELSTFAQVDLETLDAVLEQGARFCESVLGPLNSVGDEQPARLVAGRVIMPPGFVEAYRRFTAGGWLGLDLPREWGGQGLPRVVQAAFAEMVNGACVAFGMLPVTQRAAARLLIEHAPPGLAHQFAPGLISGEFGATIAITEAQAGSDVGRLKTIAEPADGGGYRLSGTKIFISNGDHDCAEQILHMVLARTPGAPSGTRGLSLFLVPRLLNSREGSRENRVRVLRLEHKMGLRASPTCVLAFEDATAYLLGAEGRGLQAMFTMVNTMRLEVAVQGVGIGGAAMARAAAYALERAQGGDPDAPPVPLVTHADVRRMLLLMRARIEALRALTLEAAFQLDLAEHAVNPEARNAAARLAQWLLPICKACATEGGAEVANLAVQLFGGHGYISDAGVEQLVRDGRVGSIYEGTNGIQALDLVQRKLCADKGERYSAFTALIGAEITRSESDAHLAPIAAPLKAALGMLEQATRYLLERAFESTPRGQRDVEAAATPYLRLAGLVGGGWMMLRMARVAQAQTSEQLAKVVVASYYATHLLPESEVHFKQIIAGAELLDRLSPEELVAGVGVTS